MKIEIKCRLTAKVLFECEADSIKLAVEKAIELKADLRSADLRYANLRSANLRYANLSSADLSSADLSSADLSSADLRYANLYSANLYSANLRSADLRSANLSSANLRPIKEDYLAKLLLAKNEAADLYRALLSGRINGSQYEGKCACLVGTIAHIRKENYQSLSIDLRPDSDCPSERWFLGINQGDTPENSQISKITAEWTEEFMKEHKIEIPRMRIEWE